MKIHKMSLLFEDIPEDVRADMTSVVEDIVLRGKIPHPYPEWMAEWLKIGEFSDKQHLMVISTVLPARVLISIVRES